MGSFVTIGFVVVCVIAGVYGIVSGIREGKKELKARTVDDMIKKAAREAAEDICDSTIYPYVVPAGYLQDIGPMPDGCIRPLGHGIYSVLASDLGGMVRIFNARDIQELNKTPDEIYQLAIANLERVARDREVDIKVVPKGPQDKPFILFTDHWTAATCILLPKLRAMATQTLGTGEFCISIPHRDVMLVFAKGDKAYRDEMMAMIREKETPDAQKPLTWDLFEFRDGNICEFTE
ncbi:MAG: hypothetical protein ABFD69_04485 [Candidatus Sumerlaeia bacterium]